MQPHRLIALPLLLVALLTACQPQDAPKDANLFKTTASIQDIMKSIVDPAADTLWESVETIVTAKGTETRQPRTEEEWQAVRKLAVQLAEAGNLLSIPGRKVAHPGQSLEDSHVAGILKAPEIEAKIKADQPAFNQRARALQEAAELALAAIDAKDPQRLVQVGGHIDRACEQCHLAYWYPNDKRPTEFVAKGSK